MNIFAGILVGLAILTGYALAGRAAWRASANRDWPAWVRPVLVLAATVYAPVWVPVWAVGRWMGFFRPRSAPSIGLWQTPEAARAAGIRSVIR